MAKHASSRRKRRQRRPNVPQYTGPIAPVEESEPQAVERPGAKPAAPRLATGSREPDWPAEYPFVGKDLRNMFIVAALMVVLLLTLNFFVI